MVTASESLDPFVLAQEAAQALRARTGVQTHDIALTLGSGWSGAADLLGETVAEIPAVEIPGFSKPALEGHVGTLRSIKLTAAASSGVPTDGNRTSSGGNGGHDGNGSNDDGARHALVIGARTHFYEGRGVRAVVHGVRTAAAAGAKTMVLTNGCGGLNPGWAPGTPVLISDHLNLTATSPLEGATFVDLTDLYSQRLRDVARSVDPTLDQGVYAQFPGPHYETPAEVRMAGVLGADLVGMSTALEAIAARQAGLEVLGISLVTNLAAGIQETPLSHDEVVEAGRQAGPRIAALLAEIVREIR